MHLYLIQHGEAWNKEQDGERSLSEGGIEAVNRIRDFLENNHDLTVSDIFHSGKLRAKQTADIVAKAVHAQNGVSETEGLKPMDDPAIWAGKLRNMNENVMLVGHMPHLSRLAGLLISSAAESHPVHFHNGGVVSLVRDAGGNWSVDWIVIPGIVR